MKIVQERFAPIGGDVREEVLTHVRQLTFNIDQSRRYHGDPALPAERARSITQLDRLCLAWLRISFQELCSREESARNQYTPEESMGHIRQTLEALRNEHLLPYLRWKYSATDPLFERAGYTYPITVYRAPPSQRDDIESVLIRPVRAATQNNGLVVDSEYRQMIERASKPLMNLPTFTMRELVASPERLGMRCEMGRYFDMIDTCDDLEWEMLKQSSTLRSSGNRALQNFDERLTLRHTVHEMVQNPARDGAFRSVAVSLSCVIAFHHGGKCYLMIRKRSADVAVHPNLLHVVPSFMFQPTSDAVQDVEYSIQHQIFREYLEEVFNRPDPKEEGENDPHYFEDDERLCYLQDLLAHGQARFYFTGVAVNLLSLRPEICTVLHITSEEWYARHNPPQAPRKWEFHLNGEFVSTGFKEQQQNDRVPLVGNISVEPADEAILEQIDVSPLAVVPCGAAAFWLAVDLVRELEGMT